MQTIRSRVCEESLVPPGMTGVPAWMGLMGMTAYQDSRVTRAGRVKRESKVSQGRKERITVRRVSLVATVDTVETAGN